MRFPASFRHAVPAPCSVSYGPYSHPTIPTGMQLILSALPCSALPTRLLAPVIPVLLTPVPAPSAHSSPVFSPLSNDASLPYSVCPLPSPRRRSPLSGPLVPLSLPCCSSSGGVGIRSAPPHCPDSGGSKSLPHCCPIRCSSVLSPPLLGPSPPPSDTGIWQQSIFRPPFLPCNAWPLICFSRADNQLAQEAGCSSPSAEHPRNPPLFRQRSRCPTAGSRNGKKGLG